MFHWAMIHTNKSAGRNTFFWYVFLMTELKLQCKYLRCLSPLNLAPQRNELHIYIVSVNFQCWLSSLISSVFVRYLPLGLCAAHYAVSCCRGFCGYLTVALKMGYCRTPHSLPDLYADGLICAPSYSSIPTKAQDGSRHLSKSRFEFYLSS